VKLDKKILIGGGIAAAAVIGLLMLKHAKAKAQEAAQQSTPVSADMGFISSMPPVSGGMITGDLQQYQNPAPAQADNSGSTSSGGGFDLTALLGGLLTSQTQSNQAQVTANEHNNDSAVLATIISSNGSASVTHSVNGTTITNTATDPFDSMVSKIYQEQLHRAPDTGGLTYWKNAMENQGLSVLDVTKFIQSSDEYKKAHQTTAS